MQHLRMDEVSGNICVLRKLEQGRVTDDLCPPHKDKETRDRSAEEENWIPDLWYGSWELPKGNASDESTSWETTLESLQESTGVPITVAIGVPRSLSVHPLALCNVNWCTGYEWVFAHDQMTFSDSIVTPVDNNVDGIPGLQGLVVPEVRGGTLSTQLLPERELEALYSRYGGIDNVIPMLSQRLVMNRNSAGLWSDMGNAYRVKGESIKALQCFLAALRLQPLPDNYLNLGGVLMTLEEYDEAVRSFTIGLTFDPDHLLLRFSLGHVYFLLGREEEAARELRKALEIQPGYTAAQTYIDKLAERKVFWQSTWFWGTAMSIIALLAILQKGASLSAEASSAGNNGHPTRFSVRHRSKKVR